MKSTLRTLCIISTCMLLLALGAMPYGYYIFLKIAVCATFMIVALRLKDAGAETLALIGWAIVALYNPIIRIPLNKDTWSVINLVTVAAAWLLYRKAYNAEKAWA
jgi:hypothetical protein